MKRLTIILFCFIVFQFNSYSLELGRQPYKNFTYREYSGHYQNWSVVQDKRGLIYAANNTGVLEFDGSDWRTISIFGAVARCLDVDDQGRIWVGAQDEMGYLAPDSVGTLTYNSINHLLNGLCEPIGLVRQVYATSQGVVFSSNTCIVRVNGYDVEVFYPNSYFDITYYVHNKVYTVQPGVGLTVLEKDTFVLVPSGERFAQQRIYSMLPYNNSQILIATQSNGFFLYDISDIQEENSKNQGVINPFATNDSKFFKDNWVYCGVALANNRFAFGTYRGGAAIINSDGEVIQYIGKNQGIQDETVWHIAADNQENLWLALNNGISYTTIKSPITSWDSHLGPQGVLQSVRRGNGNLYISSNTGVYRLVGNGFQRVKGILDLSWDITRVITPNGEENLLVATGTGIYTLDGDMGQLIENGAVPAFHVYQSKYNKNFLYIGLYEGLGVAEYKNGKWVYLGRFEGITGRVWGAEEDDEQNLWFVIRNKGVVKAKVSNPRLLKLTNSEVFTSIIHSPPFDEDTRLFNLAGKLRLSSPMGLYQYDNQSNAFIPDSSLGSWFAGGNFGIKIFLKDHEDYLWYETYSQSHIRSINRSKVRPDGTFINLPAELNELPRMIFSSVDTDPDGVTWIAGADGLFRFDPSLGITAIKVPKVFIRKITYGQNSLLFGGAFHKNCPDGYYWCIDEVQNKQDIPQIPFAQNSIRFHFSSPLYGQEDKMMFAFMLEGFDDSWSDWSHTSHKEYTNLPSGDYTFRVKAISVFDVESPVIFYDFQILRPWYNHPAMYALYIALVVVIVTMSVWIKTRMLRSSNLRLQKLIDERTKEIMLQQRDILMKNEELVQQKEEIETQKDELDFKNRQTNSSIEYAQTIQKAILPSKAQFEEFFESFITFKPKDVVSGDFYWFTQIPKEDNSNKLLVAVADCTGHGVPGAFMSMIGSRMLSEIVNERRIYDPAVILTTLNKMLNKVLNQKDNENFDGMDIAICAIDRITPERYLITFSGANRPLAYYRQGATSITVVKGNRKSIGGILPDIDKVFENQLVDLVTGDTLFLFTDGYTDQNNEFGKKFTTCRFYTLLQSHIDQPMKTIGKILSNSISTYMAKTSQRDDIEIIVLRLR